MRLWAGITIFGVLGAFVAACSPAFDPGPTPDRSSFSDTQITNGAKLAALGNCITCHTKSDGKPFAGGRALPTPFGTIYASNITPDPDTGIGDWSKPAFRRAMTEGLDREGHHLYPAFPYDHFTHLTDPDIDAIYAYLMTREPVKAQEPPNELKFPFNIRGLLVGWNTLFLKKGPLSPSTSQSAEWAHGRYLVEAIAHCSACHTPRNLAGAEKSGNGDAFAGGEAEGWTAPALNAHAANAVPWTTDRLASYLRNGWDDQHGLANGPMKPVIDNMAQVSDEDIRAIAVYIASFSGTVPAAAPQPVPVANVQPTHADGAAIYAGACAACHDGRELKLAKSTSLHLKTPDNAAHYVVEGVHPEEGEAGAIMPGFAGALTDTQIAAVLAYLREDVAGESKWDNLARTIRDVRESKGEKS